MAKFLQRRTDCSRPAQADLDDAAVQQRIAYTQAVADWCLRQASRNIELGNMEAALEWDYRGAEVLNRVCKPLVSEMLEGHLLEIASHLPRFVWCRSGNGSRRRWLHVIDHALPYGGSTAMARRWIANNPGGEIHNVALPMQEKPVPNDLADAVRETGGTVFLANQSASLLSRSIWLRELAYANADCVVLHMGTDDVVVPVAFGIAGGPPVLLVNHCAHTFWVGATVVDLVINCRGSQLERFWTAHYRGLARASTLPIPVPEPQMPDGVSTFTPEERADARQRLNLPEDAVVLLSVGRDEKYHPVPGLDFFDAARSILESCPKARMLVVGPSNNDSRKKLSEELNGRIAVLGCQLGLRSYYAAADLYLESFPFGSTTALLEAGVHGLPCVLAPESCPPPFGTDGVALDDELPRASNVKAYIEKVRELITNQEDRLRVGASLALSIRKHHCATGWTRYLSELVENVPDVHAVRPAFQPPSPPEQAELYWTRSNSRFRGDPLFNAFRGALLSGITPRLDGPLLHAWRTSSKARRLQKERLKATVAVFLSGVLPLLPAATGRSFYRILMRFRGLKQSAKSFVKRARLNSEPVESAAAV